MDNVVCKLAQEPQRHPGDGDWSIYLFRFSAVQASKWDKPDEPSATYYFWVQLRVTGPLLACMGWQRTPEADRQRYFFQFVQDELKKRPPPPRKAPEAEVIRLDLTSHHALANGPETQYTLDKITPFEPFLVPAVMPEHTAEPIGFRRA